MHPRRNLKGEGTGCIDCTNVIISCSNFYDLIRHYYHWNTDSKEDGRHDEEKDDSFGQSGNRKPCLKYLLLELLEE